MQVRNTPSDRALSSDTSDIFFGVLTECSAIARSRKRKLCILYEVAASPDSLPKRSFADPDAQPTNPAESLFLEGCDILQYVSAIYLYSI